MRLVSLPFVRLSLILALVAGLATLATVSVQAGDGEDRTAICHLPGGNPAKARTVQVGADALAEHLEHGDLAGECVADTLADHQDSVPDGMVLICHVPQGNHDNAHELVLSEEAVDEHLNHDGGEFADEFGTCEGLGTRGAAGPRLTGQAEGTIVCHKDRTRTIAAGSVQAHLDHDDRLGACDIV